MNSLGVPVHASNENDVRRGGDFVEGEFVIDMQPIAYVFEKGSRIRITLACADKDNARVDVREPAPEIVLHVGGPNGSHLVLPEVT
jgi:hypothetical protein